jgi:hypothetical protein
VNFTVIVLFTRCKLATVTACIQSQVGSCVIYGRQSDTGTGFLESWSFPCQLLQLLWLYMPLLGLGRFFGFLILYTVGRTPWTGISPLQSLYLRTKHHKHRINAHNTHIHALSGIGTHDLSVRAHEDRLCLRPRGHCDRLPRQYSF